MPVNYAAAALAAAQRYCGWIVTPPATVTVTLDGPGGRVLSLPSLYVTDVSSVVEDGVDLDVSDLLVSPTGLVRKKSGACWSSDLAAIEVTMTHGFDSAPDFDAAVEQAAAAMLSRADMHPALTSHRVDDVEDQWSATLLQAGALSTSLLAPYRILPSP